MTTLFSYPLHLSFKSFALLPQIYIRDAQDRLLWYVRKKVFTLKESATVYADEQQTLPLFEINTDRIFEFNRRYSFTRLADDAQIGSLQCERMRSLLWTQMKLFNAAGACDMLLCQEQVWFSFTPTYFIKDAEDHPLLRIRKNFDLFRTHYVIDALGQLSYEAEHRALLGLLMMTLIQKVRDSQAHAAR